MNERLLRIQTVTELTGLSRATVYRLLERREFPVPLRISERAVAWRASEVQEWIESRRRTTER